MEGEAFFDVRKDPSSVFTVHGAQVDVRVLGTTFLVADSQSAASVIVQVLSGRVGVAHGGVGLGELGAGRQLVYERGVAMQRDADSTETVAWIHKTFTFNETPLQSVFAAIEARFNVHFVIRKKPGDVKLFTGMFSESDSLKDILLALSLSTGIRYSTIDKRTIAVNYP
jgi:ferric-dicitrate binding protein FerR (iron transport regulator)